MPSSTKIVYGSLVVSAVGAFAAAFQPSKLPMTSSKTALKMVPADPSLMTKKEFQDVCGVDFDKDILSKRLERTNFLYPRHVEVIEDIAPIAGEMVGEIVSKPADRCSMSTARLIESFLTVFFIIPSTSVRPSVA